VFKSHLPFCKIPKGPCKYIYVARDGKDVALSYYHFHKTHMRYTGDFEEFYERFLKGEVLYGSWVRHVQGWWKHRKDTNVLFLHYEDLAHDLEGTIHRIIAFLGLEVTSERFPRIQERCGFAFMKKHEERFDPLTEMLYERGFQLNSHLRQGQVGGGERQLTAEQDARFEKAFGKGLKWLSARQPFADPTARSRVRVAQSICNGRDAGLPRVCSS
jgi:hypothetical protein